MTQIPLLQNFNSASPHFSRWMHLDVLIDTEEMKSLFDFLGSFNMLSTTQIASCKNPFIVDNSQFLDIYEKYIQELKHGKEPSVSEFRPWFHLHWTTTLEGIARVELTKTLQKLYIPIPTILIKPICLQVSGVDHTIRISSIYPGGYFWGLRFSFPGLFQPVNSHTIEKLNPNNHPNANLFKQLRVWLRKETLSPLFTPPLKLDSSIYLRLGNQCREWIKLYKGKDKEFSVF